jgi:hypothetical protein
MNELVQFNAFDVCCLIVACLGFAVGVWRDRVSEMRGRKLDSVREVVVAMDEAYTDALYVDGDLIDGIGETVFVSDVDFQIRHASRLITLDIVHVNKIVGTWPKRIELLEPYIEG